MREIKIDKPEILKLMQEREKTSAEAKTLQNKFGDMQEEMEKIKHKMERLKEKTVEYVKDVELEEFEYITIDIKDDIVTLYIKDQVEEIKETLREQKAKQKEAESIAKKQAEEKNDKEDVKK